MSKPGIEGFVKLDAITSFYRPVQANGNAHLVRCENSPTLIVLCSWMGAAPKHVAKYTKGYQELYPDASILLIESTLHGALFGTDLTAACEFLAPYTKDVDPEQPILLHMYSNGGTR